MSKRLTKLAQYNPRQAARAWKRQGQAIQRAYYADSEHNERYTSDNVTHATLKPLDNRYQAR